MQVLPAPVNHGALLRQIAELRANRAKPEPWGAVRHALDLTDKELRAYRWLAAARLKAEQPQRTWRAIAADPAVDLAENTLKKNHASAVLPTGQSWAEYVEAFQSAMRERLAALQRIEGVAVAETFFGVVQMQIGILAQLTADLRDQLDNPPDKIATGRFDAQGHPLYLDTTEQLVIAFPGLEGEETVERKRRSLAYNALLREEAEGLHRALTMAGKLLLGKPEEAAEAEERRAPSLAELEADQRELDLLLRELRGYSREVA